MLELREILIWRIKMETFTLYLDESKFNKKNEDTSNRLYAVAGVAISGMNENEIRNDLNKIKLSIWNKQSGYTVNQAKMSIFHEAEMRSNNNNIIYKHPEYEVFLGQSSNFNKAISGIGNIINKFDLKVFGAIVDQTSLKLNYGKNIEGNAYESYNIALKVILENFAMFLKKKNAWGRIVFESRQDGKTKVQDERTKKIIYKILTHGTSIYSALDLQNVISDVNFRKKTENVPGLQIADFIPRPLLLAYSNSDQSKPSIYKSAIRDHRYDADIVTGKTQYGVKLVD